MLRNISAPAIGVREYVVYSRVIEGNVVGKMLFERREGAGIPMVKRTRFVANESHAFRHKNGVNDDCSQSGADVGRLVLQKPGIAEAKDWQSIRI